MQFSILNRALILGLLVPAAHGAGAAVVYTYTAGQPAYFANVNSSISVPLYLQETLSGGSTSVITANGGMLGVGISVMRSATVPSNPAFLSNFSFNNVDFSTALDSTDQFLTPTGVEFSENIASPLPPGVELGNTGGGAAVGYSNRIYLGMVFITTGATANVTTNFDVWLDDVGGPGSYTLTTMNSLDLDVGDSALYTDTQDAGPTEFSVTTFPAPEPAGLALILVTVGTLLRRRRRT